jgi:hypothetical protein
MTALAFDTHKAVKALREAGANESLAEAVVATVGDAIGGNVATKIDIAEVKADIAALKTEMVTKAEFAEVKADIAALKTEIASVEARVYRHLWAMAASIVGLTVALVKLIQ